ncbi:Transcriptional regulator OS=Streptomyces microflavus OX=1919 GN=Smic_55780 PE=4 SV=1 [Streptomyces microflavus]
MSTSGPNASLDRLFRETGWTLRQCAQAVNRIGTERGTPTQYRAPSVHQWLRGGLPREDARPLILEAFARKLGRPVAPSEAGFPAPIGGMEGAPLTTVDGIIDLGRLDMDPSRRSVLGVALFSVALTVPDWPDVVGRMEAVQQGVRTRMGMSDVHTVAAMTEQLSSMDDQFGGRTARPLAAAFLVNTVVPFLRSSGPDDVRKAMMSAASDLCYLTGYMAVDEGLHGLAQRYYLQALELAGASEDHLTFCTTLRGMSVQAVDLGQGPVAMRLADAAAASSPQAGPRMRAFLAGQQAHAAAQIGDRRSALMYLQEAETAMDKAEARGKVFGSYDPASLSYHTKPGAVRDGRCARRRCRHAGIGPTAIRHLSPYAREGASDLAPRGNWQRDTFEAACKTWGLALDDYPAVNSGRIDKRMTDMFHLIRPHIRNHEAQALYERARATVRPELIPA